MNIQKIKIPIYGKELMLIQASREDTDQFRGFLGTYLGKKYSGQLKTIEDACEDVEKWRNMAFLLSNTYYHKYVIVIVEPDNRIELISQLSHEIRHFVDEMGGKIGLELEGEAAAYLTQYVMKQCLDKLDLFDSQKD